MMRRRSFRWLTLGGAALLAACAAVPPPPAQPVADWQPLRLPGKRPTLYEWDVKEGRRAVRAWADRSASLWRRPLPVPAHALGEVRFSWWVPALIPAATVAQPDRSDAPARVVFAFAGDHTTLSPRNRAMFELAHTLSGERPPYATLMYVWDAQAPVGTVIVSARSDRIRKLVVESGPQRLRQWRDYRRDLAQDFRHAFGEAPGALLSVALMTDADNTQSSAQAWYGDITLDRAAPE